MTTFAKYKKQTKLAEKLLRKLEVILSENFFIRIDFTPDYDMQGGRTGFDVYYFRNTWNFKDKYEFVLEMDFHESTIFSFDAIKNISQDSNISVNWSAVDQSDFLMRVKSAKPGLLEDFGFPSELEQFTLQSLRMSSIDNNKKNVCYEGSFMGALSELDMDYDLYTNVTVWSVPPTVRIFEFYRYLLAESYMHLLQQNHKLSYFLLFSAFENFVNVKGDAGNDKTRLDDKVSSVFKSKLGSLFKHPIYSSMVNDFNEIIDLRNTIVHGNGFVDVSPNELNSAFIFFLTLIVTYEHNLSSFDEISTFINVKSNS